MTIPGLLSKDMDPEDLRRYYHSKDDLVSFCRSEGLPVSGCKDELLRRVDAYVRTGERVSATVRTRRRRTEPITPESLVEEGIVCSEMHREFFKSQIGPGFRFNVPFMEWLKSNPGRTYSEAVDVYRVIASDRSKREIPSQFQYNRYVRAFMADNPDLKLSDAAVCWNRVRRSEGPFIYSRDDLSALDDIN